MNDRIELRNWLLVFAATAIMVALCNVYVDRAAADLFHRSLPFAAWVWIVRCLAPLNLTLPIALLLLLGCWVWVMFGGSLPRWTPTLLLCCWATVWAALATVVLKYALGRGSPDPAFLRDHLYGFHLLHGGPHRHSFPSGTAAISAAILAVFWMLLRRWRAASTFIVALLCVAVVVTNYHWVGDVIAGAFLGALVGRVTVQALVRSKPNESA